MPSPKTIIFLMLFVLLILWQPLAAQEQDVQAQLKDLRDLLAQQQKELAAQRTLIEQLQGAQQTAGTEPHAAAVATPAVDPTDTAQQQAKVALAQQQEVAPQTVDERNQALMKEILKDPSNTIYDPDFIGAWYLPGTTAAMKIGGYVDLSIVNSFDPLGSPDQFIVGSIPPKGTTVEGAVKGTSVTASRSRVNLEYREQTKQGNLRAFVEGDFQGEGDTFRLRHAFGQIRSVLAGKTWSTMVDLNNQPEELDNEGISGQINLRQAQIRWSPQFGEKLKLNIALEDTSVDVLNGTGVGGRPDLVTSVDHLPRGILGRLNYRLGFVLRDLKAKVNSDSPTEHTTGWGMTLGGRQPLPWWGGDDFMLWQLNYGKGFGHYITDLEAVGGGDVVFSPQGNLEALPVFAGYVTYQHRWPMTREFVRAWPGILRSSLTLSWVDINNYNFQEGGDYASTLRASINLIYTMTDHVNMGVEFLWGERKNKDGSKGTATQLQMGVRYSF